MKKIEDAPLASRLKNILEEAKEIILNTSADEDMTQEKNNLCQIIHEADKEVMLFVRTHKKNQKKAIRTKAFNEILTELEREGCRQDTMGRLKSLEADNYPSILSNAQNILDNLKDFNEAIKGLKSSGCSLETLEELKELAVADLFKARDEACSILWGTNELEEALKMLRKANCPKNVLQEIQKFEAFLATNPTPAPIFRELFKSFIPPEKRLNLPKEIFFNLPPTTPDPDNKLLLFYNKALQGALLKSGLSSKLIHKIRYTLGTIKKGHRVQRTSFPPSLYKDTRYPYDFLYHFLRERVKY